MVFSPEGDLMSGYVELQVTTNFSFLRGASHVEELMEAASEVGLEAIAVTDRNTLRGIVRAHHAAKSAGVRLVVGARLDFKDFPSLLCFPMDHSAYGRLARMLTLGKQRAPKGQCHLFYDDLITYGVGQVFVVLPPIHLNKPTESASKSDYSVASEFAEFLSRISQLFPKDTYLAAHVFNQGDDHVRLAWFNELAANFGVPLVATNDVHYHLPSRRPLQDMLTCIRENCTIEQAGYRVFSNAERYIKSAKQIKELFRNFEKAVKCTVDIASRCLFSVEELRYEYPSEKNSNGLTAQNELERLTWVGAAKRYPEEIPPKVEKIIRRELNLVQQLDYAPYFLTVHDIVRYAKEQGILYQGRGSAANSAVCYCLHITAVDPDKIDLLFERFVSKERNEPPDIDVDFEHERREEVIQYIYRKYGRQRAGMAASYVTYKWRSAIRDVAKALGLSEGIAATLARHTWGSRKTGVDYIDMHEIDLNANDPQLRIALHIAKELIGFPRHLSQHPGGMVITRDLLSELVPISNSSMDERTVIEWDKVDLDLLGILKIDILGLGILSCIRRALSLLSEHYGISQTLATIPHEDPEVYRMLSRGDSVGIFQVESRAQMNMLPRLKPRNFYDLVIEVALVRPGPIQGEMVHPYLRRRNGMEKVSYPSEDLYLVLRRTLGVPLFQEQAMQIAIVGAGFSPGEADGLRRSMAAFRCTGAIESYRNRFIRGMVKNGYSYKFSERCFSQIEGFGEYGFPESHAASFAVLVYASAWLKCSYPSVFACALLNSQPMGFYAPAQIVNDARKNGVVILPVDINYSSWNCKLEATDNRSDKYGLRLGFRMIKSFAKQASNTLLEARHSGLFKSTFDLWRRTGLDRNTLEKLAAADVFNSVGLNRRKALWQVKKFRHKSLPLFEVSMSSIFDNRDITECREREVILPDMETGEEVVWDYSTLRLTLKDHPMKLLRPRLSKNYVTSERLIDIEKSTKVWTAGLIICRQQPKTASGVIFITLEDEVGFSNVVIKPSLFKNYRRTVINSCLLGVYGAIEREGSVVNINALNLVDLTDELVVLGNSHVEYSMTGEKFMQSHDFR